MTYKILSVLMALLFVYAPSFAQTVNVRVKLDISNLHADTDSILVMCHLTDGEIILQGYSQLSAKNALTIDIIDVPINVNKDINQYTSASCQLQMCLEGSSIGACKTPLAGSKVKKSEQYRAYNDRANNVISAKQNLSGVLIPSLFALPTSAVSSSSSKPTHSISATTASNTGSASITSNGVLQSSIEATTSTGIETGVITEGNEAKITLSKSGNANGRVTAMINSTSLAALCLANCDYVESDILSNGSLITIAAFAEDSAGWTIGDDRSVFTGWSGDDVCSANANGNQTQFTLDQSVTCVATFTLVPPNQIVVHISKKRDNQASISDAVGVGRTDSSGQVIVGQEGARLLTCPYGCSGKTSNQFPANSTISMKASPDDFHKFDGWTGDAICAGSTNGALVTISPNQDINCTANFSLKPVTGYTLRLGKLGSGKGTVIATIKRTDVIGCDADCQSTIEPVSSTHPDYWSIVNAQMHQQQDPEFTLIDCDSSCSSVIVNNLMSSPIAEHGLTNGLKISIHAIADVGSEFAGFTGDCANVTEVSTHLLITKDSYCVARFNKINNSNNSQPQATLPDIEPVIELDLELEPNIVPGTMSTIPNF